jgi:hypothetical protein
VWDWLFQFLDPLEQHGVPYAVVGSVASSVYGEPRATNDLDLVVQVSNGDAERLIAAFPADRFYLPPLDTIAAEFARADAGHVNIIALDSMVKLDLYPLPVAQREWFARRRRLEVAGRAVWFAASEVIVLHKLLFFRVGGSEKHLRDIAAIFAVESDRLDRGWMQAEARRLGIRIPEELRGAFGA